MNALTSIVLFLYYAVPALVGQALAGWLGVRRVYTGLANLSLALAPGACWIAAQHLTSAQKSLSNVAELYLVAAVSALVIFLRLRAHMRLASGTATGLLLVALCAAAALLAAIVPPLPE